MSDGPREIIGAARREEEGVAGYGISNPATMPSSA